MKTVTCIHPMIKYADYAECQGQIFPNDLPGYCYARSACVDATIVTDPPVYCTSYESCQKAVIESTAPVECSGAYSCKTTRGDNSIKGAVVNCQGIASCAGFNKSPDQGIYGEHYISCGLLSLIYTCRHMRLYRPYYYTSKTTRILRCMC